MKNIIAITIVFGLFGCKSKMEKVRDYDMTTFCKNYHVLINPGNDVFYVLIDRENKRERFVVYKDLDKQGSGYGFCYGCNAYLDEILKGGVFETVQEAVAKGKNDYRNNGTSLWLSQFVTFDDKKWIAYGETMQELCPQ